ncbi:MAG: dihydroneopterin aldolase [Spirochaetes bacterium GWF1_31_7]|nr:MAG: dihydroneopterin aldolase [Spirochaetes bacterium GWE1_32_154]OHD48368.1 MAG: dihydroneopterin aldolase [Spirochaetes bacterium GWF1_31_7]OHD50461.1 MAG: dihydroneopterin aldolase [Spirochaetes bacterium GWE2_31_10]OHD81599.1 MAG: dihydroneopterin aldolase [Spirochaetes bacterium RIFOXYB1_FULL_32_8]HBD96372.1 dihydroneopterin aldolase [Spirochaetia bacterium]
MAIIKIKNLKVKTIIGIFNHEREASQDLILNIKIAFNSTIASQTDNIQDTIDYQLLKRTIINSVEKSNFNLLEKLVEYILDIIMSYTLVTSATVEIDKPDALRFVDSVSITSSRKR